MALTVKLAWQEDLSLKNTKQTSQRRVAKVKVAMEKNYECSNILFLEYGAHSKSSRICIIFFNIYGGSTFGNILNIRE